MKKARKAVEAEVAGRVEGLITANGRERANWGAQCSYERSTSPSRAGQ